ncbi:MAG: mechanosensitive ion channel family protein [Myxococcota bacterium]
MTLPFVGLDPGVVAVLRPLAVFLVVLVGAVVLRALLLRQLHRWAQHTSNEVDDLLLQAFRMPSLFWCVAVALIVTVRTATIADAYREVASRGLTVLVILSVTLVVANVAGGAVTMLLRRNGGDTNVPGLGQTVIKSAVVLLGGTVLLNALGVEIAPIITALGVGGLAVALALQDTLTNFFAGIHILLERPFHIGHYIQLEDKREGHVFDIGWRTTRIKTLDDDVVVVPNSKIAGSTILNFHMPFPRSRVSVVVGVDYASDPARVRDVLQDELDRAAREVPLLLQEPAPAVLFEEMGEFALRFGLRFWIKDIATQPRALDAVNHRVFARLRAEGIKIPFPTRTLHLEKA